MSLARGRRIPAEEIANAAAVDTPVTVAKPSVPRGTIARREVVAATERARAIVERAEQEAASLVERAQSDAAALRLRAEEEGRADAAAALAAKALRFAELERSSDDRALDRTVELARLLAERLLGDELRLDPSRVTHLARQALSEAKGARSVTIVAHPDDAGLLDRSLDELQLDRATVSIRSDSARQRGSLRLETDVGVLDAEIAPQLDRLALKLRESLADE